MMLRPLRADIPIYLAAIGPKNVALAAEIADGWLPIFVDPERFGDAFGASIAGARDGFEIAATVTVLVGDDVQALRDGLKPYLALYIGGMGAKGQNFYNALVAPLRLGGGRRAKIQDLYLSGKQREAIAAVPDELVDAVALVGPKERIRDRLEAWRETPVTTLIVGSPQPEALQTARRARALTRLIRRHTSIEGDSSGSTLMRDGPAPSGGRLRCLLSVRSLHFNVLCEPATAVTDEGEKKRNEICGGGKA